MEQSDLAASYRRLRMHRKRPGRRDAHAMPAQKETKWECNRCIRS
jgi:hypothetical protein